MKLYATTTSERATKGQGGKWLDIEIMGDHKVVIARIKVTSTYPYEYNINVYTVVYPYPDKRIGSSTLKLDVKGHGYKLTRKVSTEETKGKQQKGGLCGMKNCNNVAEFNELDDSHYRDNRNL